MRLRDHAAPDIRVHWTVRQRTDGDRFVLSPLECLRSLIGCESPEWIVAAADSALRHGLITSTEWRRSIAELPTALRDLLGRVDARSESITESLMRFRLSMLGIAARPQVEIAGVGRVDLLVAERLVIELDGWDFHREREQFENDRRRDAVLAARGYRVLRFTYRMLVRQWPLVRAALLRAVSELETA
ncbi:DUF559 domain-containing protein [Galbitalea sp. SE-J8]|uniref:endonuclease domain-containing protein n=1 Tax=Galbitalea sp. SE-J8 TaxID=3054952 RepID=UPI00259C8167|nr:DUF559 domain-containing protein [Galbitalea sp. SE-J8]MDM4764221.1 DUF559 domain-containing protein [Galbitalea sp. SE-J8]